MRIRTAGLGPATLSPLSLPPHENQAVSLWMGLQAPACCRCLMCSPVSVTCFFLCPSCCSGSRGLLVDLVGRGHEERLTWSAPPLSVCLSTAFFVAALPRQVRHCIALHCFQIEGREAENIFGWVRRFALATRGEERRGETQGSNQSRFSCPATLRVSYPATIVHSVWARGTCISHLPR